MDEELGDKQWELIVPLLPQHQRRGRPRADDRRTLDGILWVLRSSACWKDLPPKYGSRSTSLPRGSFELPHWGPLIQVDTYPKPSGECIAAFGFRSALFRDFSRTSAPTSFPRPLVIPGHMVVMQHDLPGPEGLGP